MNDKENEFERMYRVLRQTLSMHAILRDRFKLMSALVDGTLLVASVIFCATTFASDALFSAVGVSPLTARYILGSASVLAFAASLLLLLSGWREKALHHRDAAQRWSEVLAEFRNRWEPTGSWSEGDKVHLSALYWQADRNTVAIPERVFNSLKARYLRKVEVSKMISNYPGVPVLICRMIIMFKAIRNASESRTISPEEDSER